MAEKDKKPEIRFAGFTDEWEQREFAEMVVRKSTKFVCNNDLPSVEYEDIVSGQGVLNKDIREKETVKTGIRFSPYDVLFGKLRPYLQNWFLPAFSGVAVGDFWVMQPSEIDSQYLYYLIQTPPFQVAANQSTGTKMPRADWNLVSKTPFYSPKNQAEQARIGQTLQAMDKLITLHQCKLDKLVVVKKSMLEKMFPKDGANVPEIRFIGFADAWEQRTFGELFVEHREKTVIENEDVLLSCAINGIYLNSELFSHQRGQSNIGYIKIKKYDLILSAQNLHLGNVNVNFRFDHGMISPAYKVFSTDGCSPEFVGAWVKKDNIKKFFLSATTEGASVCRKNIEWETLYQKHILIPSIDEQKQIGGFFRKLDKLVALHQRKLEKLKNIKKSMLEKMFV